MVAHGNKEIKKTEDGKAVKDIDEKELHGRTSYLRRSKEEPINEEPVCGPSQNAINPLKVEVHQQIRKNIVRCRKPMSGVVGRHPRCDLFVALKCL